MKKNILIVTLVLSVLMVSMVAAGWWPFESTGNAVSEVEPGHTRYCKRGYIGHPCGPGEGDCDRNNECATGLRCIQQRGVDYCSDCPKGKSWDKSSKSCVEETSGENLFVLSSSESGQIEANVPISDGTAKIPLLNTNTSWNKSFTILGKNRNNLLATSKSKDLIFYQKKGWVNHHGYFVATHKPSKKSYLLSAKIEEKRSIGKNIVTIVNEVTNKRQCEKESGKTCYIEDLEMEIEKVEYSLYDRYVILDGGEDVVFNMVYDTNGNYIKLPIETELPASSYNILTHNSKGEIIDTYKAVAPESSPDENPVGLREAVTKLQEQVADLLNRVAALEA